MTIHTYHEDIHEIGLVDGCPRCAEHGQDPMWGLDNRMLATLQDRLQSNLPARSMNESAAMFHLAEYNRTH